MAGRLATCPYQEFDLTALELENGFIDAAERCVEERHACLMFDFALRQNPVGALLSAVPGGIVCGDVRLGELRSVRDLASATWPLVVGFVLVGPAD